MHLELFDFMKIEVYCKVFAVFPCTIRKNLLHIGCAVEGQIMKHDQMPVFGHDQIQFQKICS